MDNVLAKQLSKILIGKTFKDLEVLSLINNGKSAAVFKAKNSEGYFALKIFDNELIERFGHEMQSQRIQQEISLVNHFIPNLVKIYGGGVENIDGKEFYYIIMELISGKNLKEFIQSESYDEKFIKKTLQILVQTTNQLLEQKNIVHRDIKPENIMVTESEDIILMDLGVLKLVGAKSFTDEEEKSFVGTLRYAPPEFLVRKENDTKEGWKAVNYYQIGATLHDLIMRQELFIEKIPYSNLVISIKDDIPRITNEKVHFELLQLTRDMLSKDWKQRLLLVSTGRIERLTNLQVDLEDEIDKEIDFIMKMRLSHEAKFEEIENLKRTKEELRKKRDEVGKQIEILLDSCFKILTEKSLCKRVLRSEPFFFQNERINQDTLIQNYLYELQGSLEMGFSRPIYILVSILNDEKNYTEINFTGILINDFISNYTENPKAFFIRLENTANQFPEPPLIKSFKELNIFKGIINFDTSLETFLKTH